MSVQKENKTGFKYKVQRLGDIQSMQLQQNLYSIYRLVLKLPRYLLAAALIFLLFVGASQLWYMSHINNHIDISDCLLKSVLSKIEASKESAGNSSIQNTTNSQKYFFLDERTLLNIELGKTGSECTYLIDLPLNDPKKIPFMRMASNQQLLYLGDRPKEYYSKHNMIIDNLIFPPLQTEAPLFSYFFSIQNQQNEIVLQSIRQSFILLANKFDAYKIKNGSNITLNFDELYLKFYEDNSQGTHSHEVNLTPQITIMLMPQLILKLLFGTFYLLILLFMSIFIGLFIRYLLIFSFSVFLIAYDKCFRESWGWIHQYLVILYLRFTHNKLSTIKMIVFFVFSTLGMYGLLTFGTYCIIKKIIYPLTPFPVESYTEFYIKTFFVVELFHYVICRSRTSLRYFPIFSFIVNYFIIVMCSLRFYGNMLILLNINLTLQLALFITFIMIEKSIQEENDKGLMGEYCPSMNKPRMLFYAGYDISWEKTLPPIWTYFTRWFDYGYFSEGEKCLIEKDYQLLYGRMLGLNERQEIPEEEGELVEQRVNMQEQPSNEMNLIQNDL